jgi:hypothetical protein
MEQDREITREEVYQLVWSKPTRTVAKEFGLSDVGLAKICRKPGVKKPTRGFGKRNSDYASCKRKHTKKKRPKCVPFALRSRTGIFAK